MKRSRKLLRLALLAVFGLVLVANVSAWLHARAMTRFAPEGVRTRGPEHLSPSEKVAVLLTGVEVPRPENRRTPADLGLEFETQRFPNGQGDTLEAWYVPAESAAALALLFHGYAASKESLLGVAQEFAALGVGVLLVDFYGSGGSSGSGTTIGAREAGCVAASLDHARSHWPSATLISYGTSMGGAAALRAAHVHAAQPDALIVEGVFDRMLHTAGNRFETLGLPAFPSAHLLVFWGGRQAGFDGFAHDPAAYARSVRVPTLVLHGERDPRVTTVEARALFDALPGWKRFSEYPEAGHELLAVADPARWRRDVSELLAHLAASAPTKARQSARPRPARAERAGTAGGLGSVARKISGSPST